VFTQPLDVPQPLFFGGDNEGSAGENWSGYMSDVAIYDRALSEAEVRYLAGQRATPIDPGDKGLLAWWACDEGAGDVVADVSGNGRDGIFVNGDPAWVEGVSGTAVELVGPTLIEIPPLDLELTEATMAGWIKPNGPQPDWSSIIMTRTPGLATGFNILGYQLAYHWNDTSSSWSFRGGDMIAEDDWTFAAVTIEPDKATFYVNGEAGSVNEITHEPCLWNSNVYLGGDGNENWVGRRMNGALDDVVIYDRALSAGEIRYLAGERDPAGFGYEDPFNLIHAVEIAESGEELSYTTDAIPGDWIELNQVFTEMKDEPILPGEPERVHPLLLTWLAEDPDQIVSVIIVLNHDLQIPRFPVLPDGVTRDSPRGQALRAEVEAVIQKLTAQQLAVSEQFVGDALGRFGVELPILDQFWLVSAFRTELPLSIILELAAMQQLSYIQPQFDQTQPPQDTNPNNDVDDGCDWIVSVPYFNVVSHAGTYIGLLDTGVRWTHDLFNNPDNVDFLFDFITPGCGCSFVSGCNPDDVWDHGTSSAAIIVGNNSLGNAYRGITEMTLDSFRIYNPSPGGLDSVATVDAFQCAVWCFDRIIVGEIQATEAINGAIATAADNAFNAGVAVIAANGNYGPAAESVASPGLAHKVIGVGAYDVQTLAQQIYQGRGPTTDGRVKPDFQAPTNTETACATSDTCLGTFGGTSGATPYGAGAAALARRWLVEHNTWDPGSVYAFLINAGTRGWPNFDNQRGSGQLQLPVNGWATWGKVNVSQGTVINLKINISANRKYLHAALWWPESANESHDDVDVRLIDPSGQQRARSVSVNSIFEFARVTGSLTPGLWTVRIEGYKIKSGPQKVYWTAAWHF
jgi:hypothetical protein